MNIVEMFGQSSILTVLGMSVVFGFLVILVFVMKLVMHLVLKMKWDSDIRAESAVASPVSQEVMAAASAAVNEYRKSK